jgi:bifunctional ADP-heptose synthase (sugar kinase/adenylyltransferase)
VIAALTPDILVKGADWNIEKIVGKDIVEQAGGRVATIDFVPDRSTTSIIDRILERFGSQ